MQSQKTMPYRVGTLGFARERFSIPIYGTEEVVLNRETGFQYDGSIASIASLKWRGDQAIEYSFDFELVAGVTCNNRAELYDFMKVGHALVAHQDASNEISGPPTARLILGRFINSLGVVKQCTLNAKGPWDEMMRPTACRFSGTFMIVPGYGATGNGVITIVDNRRLLSSEYLLRNFYTGGS